VELLVVATLVFANLLIHVLRRWFLGFLWVQLQPLPLCQVHAHGSLTSLFLHLLQVAILLLFHLPVDHVWLHQLSGFCRRLLEPVKYSLIARHGSALLPRWATLIPAIKILGIAVADQAATVD
jgi:hypothetical protein